MELAFSPDLRDTEDQIGAELNRHALIGNMKLVSGTVSSSSQYWFIFPTGSYFPPLRSILLILVQRQLIWDITLSM